MRLKKGKGGDQGNITAAAVETGLCSAGPAPAGSRYAADAWRKISGASHAAVSTGNALTVVLSVHWVNEFYEQVITLCIEITKKLRDDNNRSVK